MKFSFAPLKNAQDDIVGALVTCEVNTSARQALEVVRKYQRLIGATVSSMQVGLLVEDLTGQIILTNPAAKAIFGIPDHDWPPKSR